MCGGEIIELTSDLGGGKTTLTRGIARGAGFDGLISSPTFTISNTYQAKVCIIHHYDFYRIGELGLMSEELSEALADNDVVSIIEWAGKAHDMLPKERLIRIELKPTKEDADSRIITITAGSKMKSLCEQLGLKAC